MIAAVSSATQSNKAPPKYVQHLGRITGYSTDIAVFAHSVGETNQGIVTLIADASDISSKGGILVRPEMVSCFEHA